MKSLRNPTLSPADKVQVLETLFRAFLLGFEAHYGYARESRFFFSPDSAKLLNAAISLEFCFKDVTGKQIILTRKGIMLRGSLESMERSQLVGK